MSSIKRYFLINERAGKIIQFSMLVDPLIFNKRIVSSGENSCKRNYFLDGKQNVENFNTTDLHKKVRITSDIPNKTHRSAGNKEIKAL